MLLLFVRTLAEKLVRQILSLTVVCNTHKNTNVHAHRQTAKADVPEIPHTAQTDLQSAPSFLSILLAANVLNNTSIFLYI